MNHQNDDELTRQEWFEAIEERLSDQSQQPLQVAQRAIQEYPDDAPLLELGAYAALVEGQPDLALRILKKLERFYYPVPTFYVCKALALAQAGKWPLAKSLLESIGVPKYALHDCCPDGLDRKWTRTHIDAILQWKPKVEGARRFRNTKLTPERKSPAAKVAVSSEVERSAASLSPLPRYAARIPIRFSLPDLSAYKIVDRADSGSA